MINSVIVQKSLFSSLWIKHPWASMLHRSYFCCHHPDIMPSPVPFQALSGDLRRNNPKSHEHHNYQKMIFLKKIILIKNIQILPFILNSSAFICPCAVITASINSNWSLRILETNSSKKKFKNSDTENNNSQEIGIGYVQLKETYLAHLCPSVWQFCPLFLFFSHQMHLPVLQDTKYWQDKWVIPISKYKILTSYIITNLIPVPSIWTNVCLRADNSAFSSNISFSFAAMSISVNAKQNAKDMLQ